MTSTLPERTVRTSVPTLEAAFRSEAPSLLGFFIRRVTPAGDAADLVSETFLAAWKSPKRHTIEPEAMRAWLFGIARKVLSQHRRGRHRRTALSDKLRADLDTDLSAQLDGSDAESDPGLTEHVRQLIGCLRAIDQEIITLVYWEGFSQEEVAGILGKRAATVRSRLARARTLLREQLDESGEID